MSSWRDSLVPTATEADMTAYTSKEYDAGRKLATAMADLRDEYIVEGQTGNADLIDRALTSLPMESIIRLANILNTVEH